LINDRVYPDANKDTKKSEASEFVSQAFFNDKI